jgi:cytochrome P450
MTTQALTAPAALNQSKQIPLVPISSLSFARAMSGDPLSLVTSYCQQYGELVQAPAFGHYLVFSRHPDHMREILVRGTPNSFGKDTRGYAMMRKVVGNGLVTSEGDFWKRQRRIANPAFHRKRIEAWAEMMTDAMEDRLASWQPAVASGEHLDIQAEMMALTLRIVGETLLSVDVTGEAAEVGDAVGVVLSQVGYRTRTPWSMPEWVPTPRNQRFKRAIETLDRVVLGIIEERRASGAGDDLLGMLMGMQDEETGERMTDLQLRDEAMTMFLAGHETTATNLTWTMYAISQHPEVEKRLRAELAEVLDGRTPVVADLGKLTYLDRVLKESQRLYPPVPMVARNALEDVVVGGYFIPKDAYVILSTWSAHRHPDFWENPEAFDPDRFLPERIESVPRHAFMPFSLGQRKCIGDRFATMEAKLLLAMMVQRVHMSLKDNHPVEFDANVTLRSKHGMPMVLRAP